MCGIYITNIPFKEVEVRNKISKIEFRGPDYTGYLRNNSISMAHLRLSIIDLESRSNQPMTYSNLSIVFNGEIYNFKEIRDELISKGYEFNTSGDTEVLLKAYEEWGQNMMGKINGMFAFAIHNATDNTIFCSRDRLGVKPFYYYWKNGSFEICSQLRPMAENKTVNDKAVSIYLDCGYIPSPYTIFNDVHKLKPGNNLLIDLNSKSYKIIEYWNLKRVKTRNISFDESVVESHELLKDAVKIRLQSDVDFGSFLSGGIDSALITSIASNISEKKIKTFSIGFEDPNFDESKIAAQYADILQTEHTEIICKPKDILKMMPKLVQAFDEPFGDSSALPSLLLNMMTKKHVTMALSGDGGDESFLGYDHLDWVHKFKSLSKIPFFLRYIFSYFIPSFLFKERTEVFKNILKTKNLNDFIKRIFCGFSSIQKKRNISWLDTHYNNFMYLSNNSFQKTADLNIKLWLENDSNVKVDRASMAHSVEIRSPFLDYRIIENSRTIPVKFRFFKGNRKIILKEILKQYIPVKVFDQPKKGFSVPIGDWIRHELKDEFLINLEDDFLNTVPSLNIKKFKKMLSLHMQGKSDYSSFIWRVYVLSKWYKEFEFYKKPEL